MAAKRRGNLHAKTGQKTIRRLTTEKKVKAESESLAELTTQAALAGPIGRIWNAPEEDEAWAHLRDLN